MYLMFSDGAAEKSAAFSYGDYPVGTRPAGLVINKRAGRVKIFSHFSLQALA